MWVCVVYRISEGCATVVMLCTFPRARRLMEMKKV